MAITVTGGQVTKGRNVTHKRKGTVTKFDKKGRKTVVKQKEKKKKPKPATSAQKQALASGKGPLSQSAAASTQSLGVPPSTPQGSSLTTQNEATEPSSDPNRFGAGSIEPIEGLVERLKSSSIGEFISGLGGMAVDPQGRDIQTKTAAEQAGFLVSNVSAIASVGGLGNAISLVNRATAVQKSLTVGRAAPSVAKSTAASIAVNSKTAKDTASWLTKLAGAAKNPSVVVPTLMGAIGSYPFAGFIKEEALQTLGFGLNTAIKNGDLEGAQLAIDAQKDVLNPDLFDRIIAGVPFVNVIKQLKDFYGAASTKLAIDERVFNDMRANIANPEEPFDWDAHYAQIEEDRRAQRELEREEDEKYYAEIERKRQEAKAAERAADEKYWNDILSRREDDEKSKIDFDDDYWSEYYKTLSKVRANEAPSNLKFGLL